MHADLIITGGDLYTPERIIPGGTLAIAAGRIVYCGENRPLQAPCHIDASGRLVAPGFVDIHIHGGGGGDFIDGQPDAVRQILRHHARHGTTSLLATTSTAPMPKIFRAFQTIIDVMGHEAHHDAHILGIHMEGPYFAKPEPGCHIVDLIHDPTDPQELGRVLDYAKYLRRVTLAPEIPGALEFIAELTRRGVVVSGGHSNATYRQVRLGREAGITHLTHHWSAMSGVRRVEAQRLAGMIEAGLVCDDLTTEVIADGCHLPTSLLRLACKCKGPDGLCLISDAMRAAGLSPGIYEVCETKALVTDRVALTLDRKGFASSIISMDQAVQHMVRVVGLSLLEALCMASLTPARVVGVHDRKGSLAVGKDADVILLNPQSLAVEQVILRGNVLAQPKAPADPPAGAHPPALA